MVHLYAIPVACKQALQLGYLERCRAEILLYGGRSKLRDRGEIRDWFLSPLSPVPSFWPFCYENTMNKTMNTVDFVLLWLYFCHDCCLKFPGLCISLEMLLVYHFSCQLSFERVAAFWFVSKHSLKHRERMLYRISFCLQNVIAWTNLGVLYLKHDKIEVKWWVFP